MFGMKPEDFERTTGLFQQAIAAERGMTCEMKAEGGWLVGTINRKPK